MIVTPIMPLNTAVPSDCRISAPAPDRQDQRHDAEDERERRHQDGPQPELRGMRHGVVPVLARVFPLLRELHDQDRVLAREPDQHDEADLRQDVVVEAAQPDAREREENAQRHDRDDRKRQRPAFVLERQQQEDEQNAEREDQQAGAAGEALLERELGPLEGQAVGQQARREGLHRRQRVAGADAGRRAALDLRGRIKVVAHDAVGARRAANGEHRAERHHGARRASRAQPRDVRRIETKRPVGLRRHAIAAAEEIEVIHVDGAEIDLQRLEDALHGNVEHLRLRAVDVEVVLRRRRAEGAVDLLHDAAAVARCRHLERALLERFETPAGAVLQHHLEAARVADAAHGRRLDDEYLRVLDLREARPQPLHDRGRRIAGRAFLERLESDEDRAGVRSIRERGRGEPGERDRAIRSRSAQHDVGSALHDGVRSRERRALRQLDDHDHVALVLLRNEALRHDAKQERP